MTSTIIKEAIEGFNIEPTIWDKIAKFDALIIPCIKNPCYNLRKEVVQRCNDQEKYGNNGLYNAKIGLVVWKSVRQRCCWTRPLRKLLNQKRTEMHSLWLVRCKFWKLGGKWRFLAIRKRSSKEVVGKDSKVGFIGSSWIRSLVFNTKLSLWKFSTTIFLIVHY